LSARKAIAQSQKFRSFFSVFWRNAQTYRPTYNYKSDGTACQVYGTRSVCSANLTGHGYASTQYADHKIMKHIINEFSFGPYFPDITQPLDYSYEV
ncbi:hypothetical protein PILCRDRAFT_52411, partial [Piloderma croceum F 1598]